MGGWISLLLARAVPEKVAGLVTIAAAPDFTEDLLTGDLSAAQRAEIESQGRTVIPSEYEDDYIITRDLLREGRKLFAGTAIADAGAEIGLDGSEAVFTAAAAGEPKAAAIKVHPRILFEFS